LATCVSKNSPHRTLLDPAATQDLIAMITHGRLAGGNAETGLVETDAKSPIRQRLHHCIGRAAAIHFSLLTSCKRRNLDPWAD
jgi:hypothetical protein